MLIAAYVVVGMTLLGFAFAWARRHDRHNRRMDLGAVSHRWVAERRLEPGEQDLR